MESSVSINTNYESFSQTYLKDNNLNPILSENLFFLSTSKIIEEEIERVWHFFSDPFYLTKISSCQIENFKSKTKFDSFPSIGDSFSFDWVGISMISYECVEVENYENHKKISWDICSSINIFYRKTYCLYNVKDSQTLVKILLTRMPTKFNENVSFESFKEFYTKTYETLLIKMNDLIMKSKHNKNNYESFIINKNFKEIWNFITDLNKIGKVIPVVGKDFLFRGDRLEIGSFGKCLISLKENESKSIYFKVKDVVKDERRNKWVYSLETFGTDKNIIRQEIQINVIKIHENKSQISVSQIFNNFIDKEKYVYLKKRMKINLEKLKNYLLLNINNSSKKYKKVHFKRILSG